MKRAVWFLVCPRKPSNWVLPTRSCRWKTYPVALPRFFRNFRVRFLFFENFVPMSFLKNISESGISFATTNQDKRNVLLTNNLSLTLALMLMVLIVARFALLAAEPVLIVRLFLGVLLCLLPIAMNSGGYI